MKTNSESSWQPRLEELLLESRTRPLSDAEQKELNAALRASEKARAFATRTLLDDAVLAEELRTAQAEILFKAEIGGMTGTLQPAPGWGPRSRWIQWRPITAAAAGLVIGLFGASLVFGYVMPRAVATASRLFSLVDGSFEKQSGRVSSGFPADFGLWSGDQAEITAHHAVDGTQSLRLMQAEREPALPDYGAASCDVYQLVDLRSLKANAASGEATLELSAQFLDTRTALADPQKFICRLHVFSGTPASLPAEWPLTQKEALASGSGEVNSSGGAPGTWQSVSARVLLPPQADFAVVHLVMHKPENAPGTTATFGEQFADDVRLTLKTQPALPVRLAQR